MRSQENKLIQTIMDNLLRIATFNCEGINRSRDYMHNYLNESSCDILCLQETWHLDENTHLFNTINTDYLYTAISGVDSRAKILSGRPKGGVGILYKKSLSNKIKHITSYNRRVCGSLLISLWIFHVYYYVSIYHVIIIVMYINQEYSECIDYIESLYNNSNCNAFICCGDYNTSFERLNAQTECLNNVISRCNFVASWDHQVSKKEFTYANMPLNHFSCIDHIIMTNNIYDCISDNFVLHDPCNPSNHNILFWFITVTDFNNITIVNSNKRINHSCVWSKATDIHIEQYQLCIDNKLSAIDLQNSAYFCKDMHCKCLKHRSEIDSLCHFIIDACVTSGFNCTPLVWSSGRDMPGWTEQVKPE